MTTFQIKFLAAIFMVVDHIGVLFFPKVLAFRYLGRLSFPLFAWAIGQGEKHTKNFNTYLLKLIIWGVISQPIYCLVFRSLSLNILITLALGLLALRLEKLLKYKYLAGCALAGIAQLSNTSYGAYGILVIILLAEFEFTNITWWSKWSLLNLLVFIIPEFPDYQVLAILAPIMLTWWNGKQGRKTKWLYLFYPLHLTIILFLHFFIKKVYL